MMSDEHYATQTDLERTSAAEWLFFIIDELQKSEDYDLTDRLRDENQRLKETLDRSRRHWKILLYLLQEAIETALNLEYQCDLYWQEEVS
jgi:hypothetical protein